jgi:hypothetical protein
MAVELDELPDHTVCSQDLGDGEDEIGSGHSTGQRARHPETDDLRSDQGDRLAEHRGLGFDASDAPPQNAQAVDHRSVRVGPD